MTLNSRILEIVKSYGGTIIDLDEDIECMHLIADLVEIVQEHYKIEKEFDDEFDANLQVEDLRKEFNEEENMHMDYISEYLSNDKDVDWELD